MTPSDTALDAGFGERWTRAMIAASTSEAERLGELDRLAGDGDFGRNLTAAFGRVAAGGGRGRGRPPTARG